MKTMILAAASGLAALTMASPVMAQYYSRDGSYSNRDGSYYNSDGSYRNRDGSYYNSDGSYRTRNGVVCNRDGQCWRRTSERRQYMFREGQRVPRNYYSYYTTYGGIPQDYRYMIPRQYRNSNYRYIYRDNSIYVVDPTTQLVRSIIDLLGR